MLTMPIAMSDLWPRGTLVVQRVTDDSRDWLPKAATWCDRSSVSPVVLAGALPVAAHHAGVTPAALQLLRDCGLSLPDEILPYRDVDHLRRIVEQQVRSGRRIGVTYTSRQLFAPVEAYVNQPEMIADLNDKAALEDLLPAGAAPRRSVVDRRSLPDALRNGRGRLPLVLKASSRLGTAGGCDVVICRSPADVAAAYRFFALAERVVVEEFCEFTENWCLHLAVSDAGVSYCGASEQICDEAGRYHGNWCLQGAGPAAEAIEIARHAACVGWWRGYRGFMGVDMGRATDGRWLAFDLNFRNNGSTGQVLLRDTFASEWGASCTRICPGIKFEGSFAAMVDRLWSFHRRQELVPFLAFDTEQAGTEETKPICTVLVAGATPQAIQSVLVALREAGFDADVAPVREPVRRSAATGSETFSPSIASSRRR
jgi:hypothetical protein